MRWNMLIFMDGRLRGSGVFHNAPRAGSQEMGGRPPMSDKARLLQEAEDTFSGLRQAVDGLDDARLARVWLGTWSVREILIHISGWHHEMTPALARAPRGGAPNPAAPYDDSATGNAASVQDRPAAKWPAGRARRD